MAIMNDFFASAFELYLIFRQNGTPNNIGIPDTFSFIGATLSKSSIGDCSTYGDFWIRYSSLSNDVITVYNLLRIRAID